MCFLNSSTTWIRLFIHLPLHTEELWATYGGEGYVSQASWPEADESLVSPQIEKSEELIQNIIKDIN